MSERDETANAPTADPTEEATRIEPPQSGRAVEDEDEVRQTGAEAVADEPAEGEAEEDGDEEEGNAEPTAGR